MGHRLLCNSEQEDEFKLLEESGVVEGRWVAGWALM